MGGVGQKRQALITVSPQSVIIIGQEDGAVGAHRHAGGKSAVIDMGGVAQKCTVITVGPQAVITIGQKDGAVGTHAHPYGIAAVIDMGGIAEGIAVIAVGP